MGSLKAESFSRTLVNLVAGTYGNTRKINLKVDDLMSQPSIEKRVLCDGSFVYIGSKLLEGKEVLLVSRVA
jgi:hypothetical protein